MLTLSEREKAGIKTNAVDNLSGLKGINTVERKRVLKESFSVSGERVDGFSFLGNPVTATQSLFVYR